MFCGSLLDFLGLGVGVGVGVGIASCFGVGVGLAVGIASGPCSLDIFSACCLILLL